MDKYTIAPPAGSTNNSVGAEDRPWAEGHFETLKLGGGDLGSYLAESTGYGIASGCEPSINGLTVTVGAGIVHLADGTRKEIAETNITLDAADSTNPRIDLVYIDSTGTVAKITGTASASPVVPTLPTGGISVCTVSVAAGASTGNAQDFRHFLKRQTADYYFPKIAYSNQGDCAVVRTPITTWMIDTGYNSQEWYDNILDMLHDNNISRIDYLLITHYHGDHYGNLYGNVISKTLLDEPEFENTHILLPSNREGTAHITDVIPNIVNIITNHGNTYEYLNADKTFNFGKAIEFTLFCCNESLWTYLADKATDENEYSVQLKIKIGDNVSMFTGDAEGYEIPYILNNYELPRVQLLKLNHHGWKFLPANDDNNGHIYKYVNSLNPDYAVAMINLFEMNHTYALSIPRYLTNALNAIGTKIYRPSEQLKFYSNGKNIVNVSERGELLNDNMVVSYTNIFVDVSTNNEYGDGSYAAPYRTILRAVESLGKYTTPQIYKLHIATGTYEALSIAGINTPIEFAFDNVTVGKIIIENCNNVQFSGKVNVTGELTFTSVDNININDITINMSNKTTHVSERYLNVIRRSNVYCNKLNYIGTNLGSSHYDMGVVLIYSNLKSDEVTMSDFGVAGIFLSTGSNLEISKLSASDVNGAILNAASAVGNIYIKKFGTLTNVNKVISDINSSAVVYTPQTNNNYGTSSNRPSDGIKKGHMYYDTTLGHMLVWTGSKWHDCTTNADL